VRIEKLDSPLAERILDFRKRRGSRVNAPPLNRFQGLRADPGGGGELLLFKAQHGPRCANLIATYHLKLTSASFETPNPSNRP
jgi:hypothetical protein